MHLGLLWRIGSPEAASPDLVDNFREPARAGAVVWRVPPPGEAAPAQQWPMFHPSEADPEGGYRLHPYTVRFHLPAALAPAYLLRLHHLVIAPRIGHVQVAVNGTAGWLYLRPAPSNGPIRLHAGLHTTLYAEGVAEIVIPTRLLQPGENELMLTCHDGAPFEKIDSLERIRRLDRMANSAGFLYRALEFFALDAAPAPGPWRVTLTPTVFYTRAADGGLLERCRLLAEFSGASAAGQWRLRLDDGTRSGEVSLSLPEVAFGHAEVAFDLFDGEGPVRYALQGEAGGEAFTCTGTLQRRRKWQVFVTPHAHTDIGYTHRQWEVAERLSRNLDAALDLLAEAQAGAPPAFAYHLDSAWTLDNYLATRSEQRLAQLAAALRAGRVGVAANYVILLSHFAALEDLVRNVAVALRLLRPLGAATRFAAVVDVPSLTGALPAVLEGAGIRYLVHANNQDRGPFRLNGGLHRQSPYYWHGTAGGRVLVWLAKMYCELRKVCGSPPDLSAGERGLGVWLDEFERDAYAPDAVLLYGQEADNTDLDPQPAEFVGAWNEAYAYPRLVPSVVQDFFEYVESRFGDRLPSVRGDGGAYWEDGALATLAASLAARQAQAALPAAERLAALAALHQPGAQYPAQHFDEAWRQLLLYDEHTWGAFLSGTDPEAQLQADTWAVKAHMAETAAQWAARLLHSAATRHSLQWNAEGREVAVYNPHSWRASGPVTVEVARGEVVVDLATGRQVPARRVRVTNTQAVVEFWVDDLDGLAYRRYGLRAEGEPSAPAAEPIVAGQPVTLENDHYRLVIDPARACAISWRDKALDRELVAPDAYGLGQFLYARGGEGTRLMSNHAGLPEGNPTMLAEFEPLSAALSHDALGARLCLHGRVPGGELEVEWSLPTTARRVDVAYAYTKAPTSPAEAAYVAFPLNLPGAAVLSDSQLGWVDWQRDRLPGACQEWLPLQTAVLARGEGAHVLLASPDIPLFCVGDVVRGRWPVESDLTGGRLFSYVLNNYWRTNYKVDQGGTFRFRYQLTSAARLDFDAAYRQAWLARRPLYAQRLSLQAFRRPRPPYAEPTGGVLARVSPEQVVVSTLKGGEDGGYVLRLQEISGRDQTAVFSLPGRAIARAWRADLLENPLEEIPTGPEGGLRVSVPAWGLATVRFEVEA